MQNKQYLLLGLALFIIQTGFSQSKQWIRTIGGSQDDKISIIRTDAEDNIIATGYFGGTAYISETGDSITAKNTQENFIIKFNKSGGLIWKKQFGGPENTIKDLHIDASGNIYIDGNFKNYLIINDDTLKNNLSNQLVYNGFIIKFDKNGNLLWKKVISGKKDSAPNKIRTDKAGNIYTTGYYLSDTLKIDQLILTGKDGGPNFFFLKLDPSGNAIWSKTIDNAISITNNALDGDDNLILCGLAGKNPIKFNNKIWAKPDTLKSIFIAKIGQDDMPVWINYGNCGTYGGVRDIKIIDNNNIAVSGFFTNFLNIDSFKLVSASPGGPWNTDDDIFLGVLDNQGKVKWIKSFGTKNFPDQPDYPMGMEVDSKNNIYMSGDFTKLDLDTVNISGTSRNMFVAKFNLDGKIQEVKTTAVTGAAANAQSRNLAIDSEDNVYLGGHFSGKIILGNDTITWISYYDAIVWRVPFSKTASISPITYYGNELLKLYPNPATKRLFIRPEFNTSISTPLQIFAVDGRLLLDTKLSQQTMQEGIDISHLPKGLYFINILSSSGKQTAKFIKQE